MYIYRAKTKGHNCGIENIAKESSRTLSRHKQTHSKVWRKSDKVCRVVHTESMNKRKKTNRTKTICLPLSNTWLNFQAYSYIHVYTYFIFLNLSYLFYTTEQICPQFNKNVYCFLNGNQLDPVSILQTFSSSIKLLLVHIRRIKSFFWRIMCEMNAVKLIIFNNCFLWLSAGFHRSHVKDKIKSCWVLAERSVLKCRTGFFFRKQDILSTQVK